MAARSKNEKMGDEIIFERKTAIKKKEKNILYNKKNDFLGKEGEIIGLNYCLNFISQQPPATLPNPHP